MRTVALVLFLALAPAGLAIADKDIGCGLGTQLWEGNAGLLYKVIGATTNGTSGNQTFGISTGTLGCTQTGKITANARLRLFSEANFDRLARDMAHGQGETLQTFAHLMGISSVDQPAFFTFAQDHFGSIFSSDEVTAGEMVDRLSSLMEGDSTLSSYIRS